ncbi:hypothetical protein J6590_045035 [Homalodisca vitripennis]|nr:hypothetical protein J6590_045035 [Homalodisca vitripennis]
MDRPIRTMILYSFPTTSMRQRGGMKLSEKQRYKNEDRRQRFQEQYLRQSSIQFEFIPRGGMKLSEKQPFKKTTDEKKHR